MAETVLPKSSPSSNSSSIDPNSGFCSETNIFHSLRPPIALPSPHLSINAADHAFSLLRQSLSDSLHTTTTAFIDSATARRLSYADFLRRVGSLSSALQSGLGLSKGDTAFVLSPTCLEIPILYFSLLSLGVAFSPANPLSTPAEISRQIQISKSCIAFATKATAPNLPTSTSSTTSLRHPTVLIDSDEFHSMMTAEAGVVGPAAAAAADQGDTAAILFSSGTTGPMKGVELTHRNLIAALSMPPPKRTREENVHLLPVTLFHSSGVMWCLMGVVKGATTVLMTGRLDLEEMLKAVEEYGATSIPMVPPLGVAMATQGVVEKYNLSSLRTVVYGGAPLGKDMSERFAARFPHLLLLQVYGFTESGYGLAMMVGPEEAKRHGSVGKLIPNVEAKIVDPATGLALPPGSQGEMWCRSPGVMKGYVGDEGATATAFDLHGWLKTGDLCVIDDEGFVYIVDRLKELIKYKADQVPPAELEHLLLSHPDIVDSAVIPYPDEEAGQIPMAFVVRQPGSAISEAQVPPFKKVRRVAFIGSIPKTPSGKTMRKELRDFALTAYSP
ncbi:hypothetical protein Scep_018112 [Stephania cephalantha]|uniref:4-coumarate--CoA ligase n=1 Tax=Stephania cephalantha TaxID=152367 RepID=A0AAP0IQW2_9MAGN